jgi:hypothetical protein
MTEKPKRIFIDPPGVDPEISQEILGEILTATNSLPTATQANIILGKRWRMRFIGILYTFTAIVIWACVQLEIPVEVIQIILLTVGILFIIMSFLIYKNTGEIQI